MDPPMLRPWKWQGKHIRDRLRNVWTFCTKYHQEYGTNDASVKDIAFVRKHYIPKGGTKIHPAMKKQKKLYPVVGQNFVWPGRSQDGPVRELQRSCEGAARELRRSCEGEMRSEPFFLYWPYYLLNQDGSWCTYGFWSAESESENKNDLSFLVFIWWFY